MRQYGAMKYYYLNSAKEPQGSFTREEMLTLLANGTVTTETLAAAAGDSEWKPLYLLLGLSAETTAQPPALPESDLGNCPHCGNTLTASSVPAVCPHCGRHLHAGSNNVITNILFVLKHGLTFRGRATRTEFWSFYLFTYIVNQVLSMGFKALLGLSPTVEQYINAMNHDGTIPGSEIPAFSEMIQHVWILLGGFGLSMLVSWVLQAYLICTTARRLHDRGWSGWFQLPAYVIMLVSMGCLFAALGHLALPGPADYAQLYTYFVGTLCGMLAAIVFGIWLLVLLVLPSQRGANKYGPDRINPKG